MALKQTAWRYQSRRWTGLWTIVFLPLLLVYACETSPDIDATQLQKTKKFVEELRMQGVAARDSSNYERAIRLHTQELDLAKSVGDSIGTVEALNNMATVYRRMGLLDEAAIYHYEALMMCMREIHQADRLVMRNKLRALNGLGNIYLTLGELEQADSILREALAGEVMLDNKLGQAINLSNIGAVKEKLGQIDSAWIYYRHSLAVNRQIKSKLGESVCFLNFGKLHEKEGNWAEAAKEYQHAIETLADSPDDWHKIEPLLSLAELNIDMGKTEEATRMLEQGRQTTERINSLEHSSYVHYLYYKLYEREGKPAAALESYKASILLKDSIINVQKAERIENMRLALERELAQNKLDRANERYQTERTARRIMTVVFIAVIILATVIIGVLWYTLRERGKTQQILQQMNKSKEDYFANIANDPTELQTVESNISEQDRQFIAHFVDVVYSQMSKGKTDVESIAEQMELNRAQLNRRILAITGQNTLAYITQIRISKAKRLLRADITTPIGDVAAKCGFDDVAYFSRLFKQQTNMTPSQYRKIV